MKLFLILFSLLIFCIATQTAEINIGCLFPTDVAGTSRKAAIQAAVKEVNNNAQYNASFTLSVTFVDSASATAAVATQDLIAQGAAVIIGGVPTEATITMLNVSSNTPIITSVANAPSLTPSTLYPFLIRNIPSSLPQNEGVAKVILNKESNASIGVIAIGSVDDIAIREITNAIISTLTSGGANVDITELTKTPSTESLDNAIAHLRSLSTRLWGVWGQNTNLVSFAQRLKAANIEEEYIIATTDVAFTTSFLTSGATDSMQNSFACVLGDPKPSEAYTNFLATYAAEYTNVPGAPATPDIKAPYVYDSVIQIANALLAVVESGEELNGNNIMTALRSGDASFITGQVNYQEGSNDPAVGKDYDIRKLVGVTGENIGTYNPTSGVEFNDGAQLVFPPPHHVDSSDSTNSDNNHSSSGSSVVGCLVVVIVCVAALLL